MLPSSLLGADESFDNTAAREAALVSVVRLRPFDLEQRASDCRVVSGDSIEITECRRPIVSIGFGNDHGDMSRASRFSRASLDAHSRSREIVFPLDAYCHISAAGQLAAVDR